MDLDYVLKEQDKKITELLIAIEVLETELEKEKAKLNE